MFTVTECSFEIYCFMTSRTLGASAPLVFFDPNIINNCCDRLHQTTVTVILKDIIKATRRRFKPIAVLGNKNIAGVLRTREKDGNIPVRGSALIRAKPCLTESSRHPRQGASSSVGASTDGRSIVPSGCSIIRGSALTTPDGNVLFSCVPVKAAVLFLYIRTRTSLRET